jgi:short-subunit dehydrogenase
VARAGYRGMLTGKSVVVPGLRNKALMFVVRLMPRSVVRKVAAKLNTKENTSRGGAE